MAVTIPPSSDSKVLALLDPSGVSEAKRQITARAAEIGFDETGQGRIAIVASELATNLVLHAKGGRILMRDLPDTGGIELLGVDAGPGMADVDRCMTDGYSTAGTAGNGLGAMRRLADVFDLYSRPGQGTVVLAQFNRLPKRTGARSILVGAVSVAVAGESVCGDGWLVTPGERGVRVMVADGLGHGVEAARASTAAVATARVDASQAPAPLIDAMHRALAPTRGAAVAACAIDLDQGVARYSGVGNIAGCIIDAGATRSMVSHNGIVGHQMRQAREFNYPCPGSATVVMHSDGLLSRWNLDPYPGVLSRHPAILAAVLQRDFARGRDDTCVVAVRRGS